VQGREIGRFPTAGPAEITKMKDISPHDDYDQVSKTNQANSPSFARNQQAIAKTSQRQTTF
jgi:hypothetical protein